MPITVDAVGRFTIVGTFTGEDCMNVLDVQFNTDTGQSREEAAGDIAGDLLNQWNDHILPLLSANYTALEVRWVDLDSPTGSTGSRSSTDASTWPAAGAVEAETLPNNVYIKIAKILQGKNRTERNGVLRLGGIPESYTSGANGNLVNSTPLANLAAAFEALKDGINGGVGATERNLVQVHTQDGVGTGSSIISTFQPQPIVGTLRRRMPGYGD